MCWWVGLCPSLLVVWLLEVTQPWDLWAVGRVNGEFQEGLHQTGTSRTVAASAPHPCDESLPFHTSIDDHSTLASSFGSSSCKVIAPFLWVLSTQNFICALQDWSLFFLWKSYNQIPLVFKLGISGFLVPLSYPQAGKPDVGPEHSHSWGTFWFLALMFSCLWVTIQWVWDLIYHDSPTTTDYHTLLHLTAISSLSLDEGYLFLGGGGAL